MIKALPPTSYQYPLADSGVFVHDGEAAYFPQISSSACLPSAAAVPAAAMAQSLFSVLLLLCVLVSLPPPLLPSPLSALLPPSPPCPLSKCVVGRKGNKRGSEGGRGGTYQPQYRRVKWTLLVRAIAIQQESSAPLLSTPLPSASLSYSLSFSSLSSDFPEQRKGWLAAVRRES